MFWSDPEKQRQAQRAYRDRERSRLRKYWAAKGTEYRDACRAEAARLGLKKGDAHPETGWIFTDARFVNPDYLERFRRQKLLATARQRAAKTGREFDLVIDDINDIWPVDNRCPVLGCVLTRGVTVLAAQSPTIDRLDSNRGYTRDNIRIVSHRANTLRNNATIHEIRMLLQDAERLDRVRGVSLDDTSPPEQEM